MLFSTPDFRGATPLRACFSQAAASGNNTATSAELVATVYSVFQISDYAQRRNRACRRINDPGELSSGPRILKESDSESFTVASVPLYNETYLPQVVQKLVGRITLNVGMIFQRDGSDPP